MLPAMGVRHAGPDAQQCSPQATTLVGAAPALWCDAGLSAYDRANGDLRWPTRPPGTCPPAGEPPSSPASS